MIKLLILIGLLSLSSFSQDEVVDPVADAEEAIPLPEIDEAITVEPENKKSVEQKNNQAVVGGLLVDEKEEDAEKKQKQVVYKWAVPEGVEYEAFYIEIYSDSELKTLVRRAKTKKNKTIINLFEDEAKYIRVAIKSKDGLVSDFSNLSKVTYDPKDEFKKVEKKKYALGIFYAASTGTFEETGLTGTQSSLDQNSPFTLGVNLSYPMSDKWTFYSSLYVSQFSESELSLNNTTKKPPLEYGINAYAQSKTDIFGWEGFFYYAGIDFEIFQTFNTDDLIGPSATLEFRAQNVFYGTVGIQKNFKLFNRFSFVKFSLSPTLASSGSDNDGGNSYTGMKSIFYIHHSLWKRWGTGFFYKQHQLSGAGELTITRYGINVSYRLF